MISKGNMYVLAIAISSACTAMAAGVAYAFLQGKQNDDWWYMGILIVMTSLGTVALWPMVKLMNSLMKEADKLEASNDE